MNHMNSYMTHWNAYHVYGARYMILTCWPLVYLVTTYNIILPYQSQSSFGSLAVSARLPYQDGFQLIFAVSIEAHTSHANATDSPSWKGEMPWKGSVEWKDCVSYKRYKDHANDNWTLTSYKCFFVQILPQYISVHLENHCCPAMMLLWPHVVTPSWPLVEANAPANPSYLQWPVGMAMKCMNL